MIDNMLTEIEADAMREKFIKYIEGIVRSSLEYKQFIAYLKQELNFINCSLFSNITSENKKDKITIEFHHYPFTLYEIVDLVITKQQKECNQFTFNSFLLADEVMRLHYLGIIGLVPLSKTMHELAHSGKVFISLNQVFGKLESFLFKFEEYLNENQKDKLLTIINFSKNDNIHNNNIKNLGIEEYYKLENDNKKETENDGDD
jgi:hypothetical protein